MAAAREGTPPPVIGKIGRYTVFMTPPSTPKPVQQQGDSPKVAAHSSSPKVVEKHQESPKVAVPPPVQPPPQQFDKPAARSSGSVFGFFWDAVSKVQDAHSSLDEYLADWLGLNQSKYQWALNDYYENKEMGKEAGKTKELSNKVQGVVTSLRGFDDTTHHYVGLRRSVSLHSGWRLVDFAATPDEATKADNIALVMLTYLQFIVASTYC
ncbi:hypothetical protein H6P81_000863 [Aristolochia fimbriata]|uniref:Uncharacterized protein n=1 Tax=Aristolochia fimbriata TaxID=158543 RepID=A0AAV7F7X2_ARIFI|nr:hypothetical protein H6P81_000863 [Aristolochia fimbriata]